MKKVLVTGADGFLGKNLVKSFLEKNICVVAIVYPGNNVYDEIEDSKLQVVCVDLNECKKVFDVFPSDIDTMYHLAWMGVKPELRNDLETQMRNLEMSLSCFELAKKLGVKRIIVPGSTNEYLYCNKPINKDSSPSPSNAYGTVKVALRYIGQQFARLNDMEFIYMIVTGIYAADRKDNNVIFYTIDKLLRGERPSLTRLEQLWDYVYIDDVINALVLAGEKGKAGAVYAVGHGDNWPLKNYIDIIHKEIDPALPLGVGDVPYSCELLPSSCIDLSDLKRDTGFEPRICFEEGIRKVISKLRSEME